MNTSEIDFVIPWVDGEDPQWQESFERCLREANIPFDASEERYRNWHLLRFWFRGVEEYAPWVRRIHFITNGQVPAFLNINHPKIHFVRHEDYIPADALPVFSSHPIEDNMHRIEGLSERFVYFNDDFFLVGPVTPDYFFRKGLPKDMGVIKPAQLGDDMMSHIVRNNVRLISKRYSKNKMIWSHLFKWLTPRYRGFLKLTIPCLFKKGFGSFLDPHVAQPFLKSTFVQAWKDFEEELSATTHRKFRSPQDVSQWLFRYCQLAENKFYPTYLYKRNRAILDLQNHLDEIDYLLSGEKYHLVALNDSIQIKDFEAARNTICEAFERKFPNKSSFEL